LHNDESGSAYRNRNTHRNSTNHSSTNAVCNHCNCHLETRQNNRSFVTHGSREESTNYTGQSTIHSSYHQYNNNNNNNNSSSGNSSNNNQSTEEESRRNLSRWPNQSTEVAYGTGSTNDRTTTNTATTTTAAVTITTAPFTRTAPRGRAPLPPPLPDPSETTREPVTVVATTTMTPTQSSNPEDTTLPSGIDAQRDAFRRLQEELLQMKHTNRRLQHENSYLHQMNEQLERTHTELLRMTRNQLVHLDSNAILNSSSGDGDMNEGEGTVNNTNTNAILSSMGVGSLEDSASQISIPTEWRCRICYEQPISHVIIPCGHAVTCESCAFTLSDHCCVCRSPMTQVIRLYFG
jgi:hypothetical protein